MAITGIDTIDGKQIIAAGAISAKSAEMAYNDENGNPITGYLTAVPEGYATTGDLTAYQTTADMTAYQPVGDYLTATALDNVSGDWNEVSAKLDTTAFSDVSGTFLTAHQDISNKLDTTAFSDVSGSFLTAVPDTYLQNTDLSTEDGKVTAISGIPLSAGGDVPEGVMIESGLEFNAVDEISGYNGSAFAQYGAEKQWLVHDDTIVSISNSAQYALGVNLSAVAQLLGVDETVLWSGSIGFGNSATLNESIQNFKQVKFRWKDWASTQTIHYDTFGIQNGIGSYYSIVGGWHGNTSANIMLFKLNLHDNGSTTMSFDQGVFMATTATTVNPANETKIEQIIGIGRKQ